MAGLTARGPAVSPAGALPPALTTHLAADPARNNVILSLLGVPTARCWWLGDSGDVTAAALWTGPGFPLLLGVMTPDAATALAEGLAGPTIGLAGPTEGSAARPDGRPGRGEDDGDGELDRPRSVTGEPAAATRFAGVWASWRGRPARPVGAQQLHVLDRTPAGAAATGEVLRPASVRHDRAPLLEWSAGLIADTHTDGPGGSRPGPFLDRHLAAGTLFVLERNATPVGMAAATPAGPGTVRISSVYTPPAQRRTGVALACVTALARRSMAAGAARCVLYTDLDNPAAARIYARIGFEHRADTLTYALD